jgi:hypothetical protein
MNRLVLVVGVCAFLGLPACADEGAAPLKSRASRATAAIPGEGAATSDWDDGPATDIGKPVVVQTDAGTSTATGAPVGATGVRSARAEDAVATCDIAPQVGCDADSDCAQFELPTLDTANCAARLLVGIRADKREPFLKKAACASLDSGAIKCPSNTALAEDGPASPPADTEVVVRCVRAKPSAAGTCLTQYVRR